VGDIAAYARSIFERVGSADSLTPDAARLLLNYPWPGNYYGSPRTTPDLIVERI